RLLPPDIGDDRRVRGRADRSERHRVLELVDRARVVPDVGRRGRDGSPERRVGEGRRRHLREAHAATRSVALAPDPPPPRQRVARPYRPSRRASSWTSVATIRAPDAPIGCPRAIAPPLTLTLSHSNPSSRPSAKVWAANASLISIRSNASSGSSIRSSSRRTP